MLENILKKIRSGTVEIINETELQERLKEKKPLNIKLGADPTAPDLHLGHYVVLRKLKDFQDLGHKVVFIIGDFTGLVGDPSGRSKTRPPLSREEIQENAKTYFNQVFKILDRDKTTVRFNSEWLSKISFEEWFRLCSNFTISRILERDDFLNRFNNEMPIFLHEFFYPIMQAYDSYAIEADVELGGTDQKFNLIMGRKLQEIKGMNPQIAIIMPLLRGLDGEQKMSKSLGNYIGITEDHHSMFGKVMSIPDSLMPEYFSLILNYDKKEVSEINDSIENGVVNPMKLKLKLAYEIVTLFHGNTLAQEAQENFIRVFSKKEFPDEIEEINASKFLQEGKIDILRFLIENKLVASKSEAKRLLIQGAIKINNIKISENEKFVPVENGSVVKIGKRKFVKIIY